MSCHRVEPLSVYLSREQAKHIFSVGLRLGSTLLLKDVLVLKDV